jgi:arabinose-5-phosphate isomerase
MNLAPTSSTTVSLALGDALAMVLLEVRGFDENDFLKFHPGGRLGQALLQRVSDIMRGKERMPIVAPETPVLAVLRSMNEHRAGLVVVTDSSGNLAGIFTHGDFVRAFEKNPGMVSDPVHRHMTRHPITIRSGKLAVEVLNILDQHRIDDLVVVNEQNEPVGVVDSQDLTKLKLL